MTSDESPDEAAPPSPPQDPNAGEGRPRRRRRRRSRGGEAAPAEAGAPSRPARGQPVRDSGRAPKREKREGGDHPKTAFDRFDLPAPILRALAEAGYQEPTAVQTELIPPALAGKDVVARSRTGTGKTCAFLVPALAQLKEAREDPADEDWQPDGPVRILAVVPTRELAIQVAAESEKLSRHLPVLTACVYGGTRMQSQFRQLPRAAVAVGTPGRLLDHMGRGTFNPGLVDILVLDEVDRMYDLGFRDDVDRIIRACGNRKQTLLVSATLNDDVERLVAKHLGEHERVIIESKSLTVDEVEQMFYVVRPDRKRDLLIHLLEARNPDRTIVFVRTRFTADRVAYVLSRAGFDAHEIHSGLPQAQRERVLKRFRSGDLALLVATDVAARGLDIQGVDHVVNFDIPQNAEDYVHRVGRTARMGESGWAITLVEPEDGPFLTQIEKLINREIEQKRVPGFEPPPRRQAKPKAEAPAEPSSGIPNWKKPARRRR